MSLYKIKFPAAGETNVKKTFGRLIYGGGRDETISWHTAWYKHNEI